MPGSYASSQPPESPLLMHPYHEVAPTPSGRSRLEITLEPPYAPHLKTDREQFHRAVEIKPRSLLRPHMRIFHMSWMSAVPGFLGWYAIPPLMPVIKTQLGLTDGQVLNSDIASTASTIISRVLTGPILDKFGPQSVQSAFLFIGAVPVACAAFVNNAMGLVIVRFFIGLVGCIFVSSQYWTTITFAKNVVGASNAITGGLGLAGIGFAFLVLPYIYELLTSGGAVSSDLAWRLTIAFPALLMVIMGTAVRFWVDSCPLGKFDNLIHAKKQQQTTLSTPKVGLLASFGIVLSDMNTLIVILHYAVCFGAELQMNNMGALYFYEEFLRLDCSSSGSAKDADACHELSKTMAATVASFFGLMNLWARAVGGMASDHSNQRWGLQGRLYVQFIYLLVEGLLVILLSRLHSLAACLPVFILIAVAAQGAGGSSFGIVPYLNEEFTGTVTGLVGAGGNVGGVVFGVIFRQAASRQDGLLVMGLIILVSSFSTFGLRIKEDEHRADLSQGENEPETEGIQV